MHRCTGFAKHHRHDFRNLVFRFWENRGGRGPKLPGPSHPPRGHGEREGGRTPEPRRLPGYDNARRVFRKTRIRRGRLHPCTGFAKHHRHDFRNLVFRFWENRGGRGPEPRPRPRPRPPQSWSTRKHRPPSEGLRRQADGSSGLRDRQHGPGWEERERERPPPTLPPPPPGRRTARPRRPVCPSRLTTDLRRGGGRFPPPRPAGGPPTPRRVGSGLTPRFSKAPQRRTPGPSKARPTPTEPRPFLRPPRAVIGPELQTPCG